MPTLATLAREDTLDLQGLAAELVRQQDLKRDYLVDTRRIGWNTEDGATYVTIDQADDQPVDGYRVNQHAHGQVADRLKVPKRYYDRMREEAPGLLDTNVRHWLINQPEKRMVRTLDGNVRAFLSDRYRRLDNFELMEHLLPVFEGIDGLQFHVAALTDTRMYIRAILPGLSAEVKVGDVVQWGIDMRNSEVGVGALTVAPFVWRLICANGMVVPEKVRRQHVGRRIDETDDALRMYRAETIAADDSAFFMRVADIVRGTLTETRFNEIVDGLRESIDGDEIEHPVAATEALADTFQLTEDEGGSVLRNLTLGGDLSQWGLANAVTAAAKGASSYDRLVELEEVGGRVAFLGGRDWRHLAQATEAEGKRRRRAAVAA